jgi:DNA-3-methyladenine glycosylase I
MSDVVRCWETSDPSYNTYHDEEWGRPVLTEAGIYERLCLEGFQSGLSWLTILRKRPAFRAAFKNFEPDAVARFTERDVKRLLGDAGIIRHRGKIEAAIANAKATVALRDAQPLHELVWTYRDGSEADAKELSKRLKKSGFRFVGPTTVYAGMQACGVVNDHIADCWVRQDVERERTAAFTA